MKPRYAWSTLSLICAVSSVASAYQNYLPASLPADKSTPGRLSVDFTALELPDGRRIAMAASPIGLDTNSVRTTQNGRLVSKKKSGSNIGKDIAIGAAGGLLIGSLLGSNVWGAIAGGGAG